MNIALIFFLVSRSLLFECYCTGIRKIQPIIKLSFNNNLVNEGCRPAQIKSNNLSFTANCHNKENSAAYFNGKASVNIENTNDLSFLKNFTIVLSFFPDSLKDMVIFAKSSDRSGLELKFHKDGRLDLHNGHCCPITGIIRLGTLPARKWYYVAVSVNEEKIFVYLNGQLVESQDLFDFDLNSQMANEPIRIGVGHGGVYYPFFGAIDGFYIFNKALTKDQISEFHHEN